MFLRRMICAIAVLLLPAGAYAETGATLSLAQVWQGAVRTQPALRAAAAAVSAARARIDMARVPYLPTVGADFGVSETTANWVAKPGALPKALARAAAPTSLELWRFWQSSVGAQWTVTDFGKTAAQVDVAAEQAAAAKAGAQEIRRALWLQVASAYLDAWSAQALLAVAERKRGFAEQRRKMVADRVEARIRPAADLARAEAELGLAEVDVAQARGALDTARQNLAAWAGLDAGRPLATLEPLPAVAELSADATAGVAAWLDGIALTDPQVAQLTAMRASVQAELSAARRQALPALYLAAGASLAGQEITSQTFNAMLAAGVSWQGSQLWTSLPAQAEARERLTMLTANVQEILQARRLALTHALAQLRDARQRRPALAQARASAERSLQSVQARYQAGVALVSELIDAAQALAAVDQRAVDADIQMARATLLWRAAVGRLDAD